MKRLIVATASKSLADSLMELLDGDFHVISCATGTQTLCALQQCEPELLMLDLLLPELDGIEVLKISHSLGICPKTVAVTNFVSDYVVSAMEQFRVSSLMLLPCSANSLAARLVSVAGSEKQQPSNRERIRSLLASIGFKLNTGSFNIACACIEQYSQDPSQAFTTQLYPAVAKACNATSTQVEKALRDGIDSAWRRCDSQVWQAYFASGRSGKASKPSNGVFVARIADCLMHTADTKPSMKAAK